MPRDVQPSQSASPLRGNALDMAEEKVREVQPVMIEVTCCGTCGRQADGSFASDPLACRCPAQQRMTAFYRLVAVTNA